MTRVCFCVRNDFLEKFGGDTFQIKNYIEHAPSSYHASIVTFDDFRTSPSRYTGDFDYFILTNIDRSYEFLGFYLLLEKKVNSSQILILPIHHSILAIQEFYKKNHPYIWPLINALGGFFLIEKLKSIFHIMASGGFKLNLILRFLRLDYRTETKRALSNNGGIFCIANGEANTISCDFNIKPLGKYFIVRNGVTPASAPQIEQESLERKIDVLVCGRIEKRKNQLNIAKVLSGTKLKVCFVGSPNLNNGSYFKRFLSEVSKSENLEYAGAVDPSEIHNFYLSAKAHLSASWFEVSSLVDIEAYKYGCHVISSKNGYSTELIKKESITLVDPSKLADLPSLLEHIVSHVKLRPNPTLLDQATIPTWENSSKLFFTYIKSMSAEAEDGLVIPPEINRGQK